MLKSGLFKQIVLLWALPIQLFSFIPAIYLNDLQKPFEAIGKPYLNPTLGFIFATRLASQMRFYGCYEFGFKENGQREFAKDEGQDGAFKLIRILFPSTGGILNTQSLAKSSFSSVLKDGSLQQQIGLITTMLTRLDAMRENSSLDCLEKSIILSYPSDEENNGDRNKCFNHLNRAIKAALQAEKLQFYPKYFVEQIILGFFWQHFNTPQELEMLVNLLLQKSGSQNPDKWTTRLFTAEQLAYLQAKAAENPASLSLEERIQLSFFPDFFTKVTPYVAGEPLISNGQTNFINRDEHGRLQLQPKAKIFADCVETALRHMVNIIFYNADTQDFNQDKIATVNNLDLCRFYGLHLTDEEKELGIAMQTAEYANNGFVAIRNAWNCVVVDLNHPCLAQVDSANNPLAPVIYVCNSRQTGSLENNSNNNELKSGLLNCLNVLSRILNKPCLTQELKDAILKDPDSNNDALKEICTNILGLSEVEITIDKQKEDDEDLYGELYFNVLANDQKQAFCLKTLKGHSQLDNLSPKNVQSTHAVLPSLKDLALQHSLDSIRLLVPEWSQELHCSNSPSISYYLYSQPMQDNFGKINFLKRMLACPASPLIDQINNSTVDHLLKEITWQDQAVFDSGWLILCEFLQRKFPALEIKIDSKSNYLVLNIAKHMQDDPSQLLREASQNMKAVTLPDGLSIPAFNDFIEQLATTYPKLKILKIANQYSLCELPALPANLGELEISGCDRLSSLQGLTSCSQLQTLKLNKLNDLYGLPVLPASLEELKISNCLCLRSLEGLEACSQLKKLKRDLYGLTKLPVLPASLEELEISWGSKLNSLEGLSDCSQLKKLKLDKVSELTKLSALPDSLEELELSNCRKFISLEGLKACGQLKKLKLDDLDSLTELLALPASLEELELSNCRKLISLEGLEACSQLKKLKLDTVSKLTKLPALPASIEELEVSNGKQLISLEKLSGCQELKKLKLYGLSGLTQLPLPASLEELELSNCSKLISLEGLEACGQLKKLKLDDVLCLTKLSVLPASLEELKISNDYKLFSLLKDLIRCSQLKKIELNSLYGEFQLPYLPASLEELEMLDCCQITSLAGLNNCRKLKKLKIRDLYDLTEFRSLASLEQIEILKDYDWATILQLLAQPSWPWPEFTYITIKDINPLHIEFTRPPLQDLDPTQGVASEV